MIAAPFPWFGGKSRVASLVWDRFGNVANYVEPFAGSLAVLLGRPTPPRIETVNDTDAYLSNFWRALQHDPEAVAQWVDWPVNEVDLHARHIWLVNRKVDFAAHLLGDSDFYDAQVAGWWVWGLCCWIGSGWCSGEGPWNAVDGQLVRSETVGDAGQGVNRQLVHLGDAGQGVNRQRGGLVEYLQALADRLRFVRVCCGDWTRVMGSSVTFKHGLTGVFLDPPYSAEADRDPGLYSTDSLSVAHEVRAWAIENGDNPLLRIALCGYVGEHDIPNEWECVPWKAPGGFESQSKNGTSGNCARERIWFSPHCIRPERTPQLFDICIVDERSTP
jgi:DNA adenine methylase